MKFLTALTAELEVGYQQPDAALDRCSADTPSFHSMLRERQAFLVLVCFEEGDTFTEVKDAASRVSGLFDNVRSDAKSIALVPFAHLSPEAMSDNDQVELLLDKLQRVLANKGHVVRALPPSSANLFFSRWVFFDKMQSVRFGSAQASIKNVLRSMLRAHGSRKVLAILGDILELR